LLELLELELLELDLGLLSEQAAANNSISASAAIQRSLIGDSLSVA
jgi:hypothetical protein